MPTIVKALFVGYTIPMKTPDQNNLPKNKQEAEKNLKQQPKIPKEVIKGILAGIGSLPAIQAIGEKMKAPRIDKTESLKARAVQKESIEKYDERIKNIQKELTSLGDNIQSYDETKAEELSNVIANLNKQKLGTGEFMDGVIANKETKEKENFANNFPEAALKDLEKQRIEEDKYLTGQFENSKNIDDKAALGGEINAQIQRYAERKSELESIVNQKKQDKINERNKKENDLKELDSKSIKIVRDTLQKAREENKELNRQKKVQKEKDSELNRLKKVQDDGERLTARANKLSEKAAIKQENEVFSIFDKNDARDERLNTLKAMRNKQESKLNNEVAAKKPKRSALDRLKNSVGGAINKIKHQSKSNSEARNEANKENNPNYKPNQYAAKAAEKMKTAFSKIKDSMKVDHDKEPIVIQKLNELKTKTKNSKGFKLDISNITAKINNPNKNKNLKSETSKKSNFDKLKENVSGLLKNKKDPVNLFIAGESGITVENDELNTIAKNKAKAQKQIEKLTAAHQIERNKLIKKLKTYPNTKDNNSERINLKNKILILDNNFNKAIEIQKSIIEDN
jgi:hypothetical protein